MKNNKKLLIFGTGTLAEIASFYFENDSPYELIGYIEKKDFLSSSPNYLGKKIWEWEAVKDQFKPADVDIFIAIGYRKMSSIRQSRFEEVRNAGYGCASYVSSRALVFTEKIGENCFILENNVLQPFSEIGNDVYMWSGNHLGHHSIIDDHVFIASHAVISGKCRIGKNSFLGVNCTLHDNVTIGEKSLIGAGAIVTTSSGNRSVFIPNKTESKIILRDLI